MQEVFFIIAVVLFLQCQHNNLRRLCKDCRTRTDGAMSLCMLPCVVVKITCPYWRRTVSMVTPVVWFPMLMERCFWQCYYNCGSGFQLSIFEDSLPCSELVLHNVDAVRSHNHIGCYSRQAPHFGRQSFVRMSTLHNRLLCSEYCSCNISAISMQYWEHDRPFNGHYCRL